MTNPDIPPIPKITQNTGPLTCTIQVIHPMIKCWPILSLLSAAALVFLGLLAGSGALVFILCIAGLIAPPIIIFNLFPTKDRATLKDDGMYFERNGQILFKDLVYYQTDYLMKIKVKGEKFSRTLGGKAFSTPQEGDISFEEWRNAFDYRIQKWSRTRTLRNFDDLATPKRTYFFGSVTARLMGATLIFCAFCFFLLMSETGLNPRLISSGIISFLAGTLLLIKWH